MDRIIITIVLVILISLPFIIFNTKLSKWLTTTLRADSKKEKKENTMSQNVFILLSLLHSPLLILMVYTSNYRMIYIVLYIASAIALLLNPFGLLTDNKIAIFVYVFATFFAYLTMLTQPYALLHLISIFVLCISFTNVIREYTTNKKFFWYFVMYTTLYCLSYLVALRPSLLQVAKNLFKPGESKPVELNPILTLCVLFFVLLFYSSTMFKNYYGGPLIDEPISLTPSIEYKIKPSYEYTLSYWVYIDAVPPEYNNVSSIQANIVSSGYSVQNTYDSSKQTLFVTIQDPIRNTLEVDLYPQRWNHVVLVSSKGTLDVYLNGELAGTTHSISSTEKYLLVGEPEGIKGKMCNVVYTTTPYTPLMVQQLYLQLKSHNPPIL